MFKNYLIVAFRAFRKQKMLNAINIFGLAIGLASCLILSAFVMHETSYDSFWNDSERIYRLGIRYDIPGDEPYEVVRVPGPARQAMYNYFGEEIESVTRFNNPTPVPLVRIGDKAFEDAVYFTDPETADIFDLNIISGDIKATLNDNRSIALSERQAIKYFGTADALGKVLTIDSVYWKSPKDYAVGAVFKNLPVNTVLSFESLVKINEDDFARDPFFFKMWLGDTNNTFVKLKEGVSIDNISSRFGQFIDASMSVPDMFAGMFTKSSDFVTYSAQNISEIQLNPTGEGEMKETGNKRNLYILTTVIALIMLIACINFMNLSVSNSTLRAKEVAVRKVHGASRQDLIVQFLGETMIIAFVTLFVAILLTEITLPYFSQFLGYELSASYTSPVMLAIMAGLVIGTGLLAGSYPALFLSAIRPARVLKSNKSTSFSGNTRLVKGLVVFQFSVSIALIVCAVGMVAQRNHAFNYDLGYNSDKLMYVKGLKRTSDKSLIRQIEREMNQLPGVIGTSFIHGGLPATDYFHSKIVSVPEVSDDIKHVVYMRSIDFGHFETFGGELLAGRYYDPNIPLDEGRNPVPKNNLIINVKAIKHLGLGEKPEDVLGKILHYSDNNIPRVATIVGVIPDAHYHSVRDDVLPELHPLDGTIGNILFLHYSGDRETITRTVSDYWLNNIEGIPLNFGFVVDDIERQYAKESTVATLLGIAALITVVIACLGLLALAGFTTKRRIKEIGIRKIWGASIRDIFALLLWEFSKPVILATTIAAIVSYAVMSDWLQEFAIRIDSLWMLPLTLLVGILALVIAWLSVGKSAYTVAVLSPVKVLRDE